MGWGLRGVGDLVSECCRVLFLVGLDIGFYVLRLKSGYLSVRFSRGRKGCDVEWIVGC